MIITLSLEFTSNFLSGAEEIGQQMMNCENSIDAISSINCVQVRPQQVPELKTGAIFDYKIPAPSFIASEDGMQLAQKLNDRQADDTTV